MDAAVGPASEEGSVQIKSLGVGLADGLALVGIILTFLHEFIELALPGEAGGPSGWLRLLGLGIFFVGVWVVLHRVLQALDSIKAVHAEALGSLEVAETSRLLTEIDAWCGRHPQARHVGAAREVATHLLKDYVPEVIRRVDAFCTAPETKGTIEIEDQSPVHDFLANLAKRLPAGGLWLGITLLEQEKTWSKPDEAFSRFAATMRDRAGRGEVTVARIYHFTSTAAKEQMCGSLAAEKNRKIQLRWVAGGDRQDMSILLAPPPSGATALELPLGNGFVRQALEAGYEPICAVRFETRADGALRKATVYGREHPRTGELTDAYAALWSGAAPA